MLAEKIHVTCSFGNGSSRPSDRYDMLVIAEQLPVPPAPALVEICRETFAVRETEWAPDLPNPPVEWEEAWADFVTVYEIP